MELKGVSSNNIKETCDLFAQYFSSTYNPDTTNITPKLNTYYNSDQIILEIIPTTEILNLLEHLEIQIKLHHPIICPHSFSKILRAI